jgi:hypothetical protein
MGLFKRQSFSAPPERQILMVPVHEKVDKEEAQPILAAAAEKAAKSGLLWKWISLTMAPQNSAIGTPRSRYFCAVL